MMKSFFKKLSLTMALAMVVTTAAPAAQASAAGEMGIALQTAKSKSEVMAECTVKVGDTVDFKYYGAPKNFKELNPTWTSSNTDVATVDQAGKVTGVTEGVATIIITLSNGQIGTMKVTVGDPAVYDVVLGTAKDNTFSELTLELGATADLNFYGVKDWKASNYACEWSVAGNAVDVDNKTGMVTAVAAGTAVVNFTITNKTTGVSHNVTPVAVTVANPEVVPAVSVAAKQTTENDMILTFTGVDITKITKEDIEVYEYFVDEDGETQEYVWQFYGFANADVEAGTVEIVGYDTDEFVDGGNYVVRYVDVVNEGTAEEASNMIAETTFTASVGKVTSVSAWYASYFHNNGWWQFYDHAYTNAGSGEEIETKVFSALYDINGIDVTGHYQRLVGEDSLVTLELVNEDLDSYMTWDEETDEILFLDIPENPRVVFNVVYDDFETGETVSTELRMVVEEAPAYEIASIDEWAITLNGNYHAQFWNNKIKKTDIALYDDYDQTAQTELMNHELVIWFTDNYGNKYVTNDKFEGGWPYYGKLVDSEKFSGEGFELRYESRNPQVLVVGDDEVDGAVNSSILTTKKTGTASVNVTLYNTYDEELVDRLGVIKVTVKPERYIKTVNASNITVITDSKPDGASVPVYTDKMDSVDVNNDGKISMYDADGNESGDIINKYDKRFTKADVELTVADQYGDGWGLYNASLLGEASLGFNAVSSNTDADDVAGWSLDRGNMKYYATFDGVKLYEQAGKVSSVSYKLTVTDILHDEEKNANFRISLKYPSEEDDTHEILCKSKLKLTANNASYVESKLKTTIKVEELSNNGYAVNYADGIELITSKEEYNALFGSNKTATSSQGALYLVVYNPKNEIVPAAYSSAASGSAIGLVEQESGLYTFNIADDMNGDECTIFTQAGNYTVKLIKVTNVKDNDTVNTFTTTTTRFTVTDDRMDISFENQAAVYVGTDTWYVADNNYRGIEDIAQYAIEYTVDIAGYNYKDDVWNWPAQVREVSGVRFKKNERAKQVVINDAFIKVMIDTDKDGDFYDEEAFYYVEVPVDKTVTLEDMSLVDGDSTIKNGLDPQGNKMQ